MSYKEHNEIIKKVLLLDNEDCYKIIRVSNLMNDIKDNSRDYKNNSKYKELLKEYNRLLNIIKEL